MLDTGIITTSKMVKLIKAGCFTELHSKSRSETMEWYLNNYVVNSVSKLSITHVKKLNEAGLILSLNWIRLLLIAFARALTASS